MKLEDYKVIFVVVGLVGVLVFGSPALGSVVHLPGGEKFSELWILGPRHMASDYPFNVTENESYLVYLGVGNHLGSSAYYRVYVKFRNQTEALPNVTAGVPSSVPLLCDYSVFLSSGQVWEASLTFSFSNVEVANNRSSVGSLTINNATFNVNKLAEWDAKYMGYYYQLFMELWIYDSVSNGFSYHNRFVSLWLNMTASV
jgi:hypothetical protein